MRAFPHPFHGATHRQSTNNRKIAVVGAGYVGAIVFVSSGLGVPLAEGCGWKRTTSFSGASGTGFGAALGGYALLRSGQVDRLHHWPRNLADSFPWLPDGAVIAGEEAALEGDHATAIGFVCDAARRGLPVFATGFSLLAARLREYAGAPPDAFGENGGLLAEAGQHLDRALRVMPFVDFDRVSFAFRGGQVDDPAGSQEPFADAGDDWKEL